MGECCICGKETYISLTISTKDKNISVKKDFCMACLTNMCNTIKNQNEKESKK